MSKREFGNITYNEKTKSYKVRITVGKTPTGKRKVKTKTFKTKKQATEWLKQKQAEIQLGIYLNADKITIPEMAMEMLDTKFKAHKISETSYNREKQSIRIIEESEIGYIPIQKITDDDLMDFCNYLAKTYSNSYISKIYQVLARVMTRSLRKGIIRIDPLTDVPKPKSLRPDKVVKGMPLSEHIEFLHALDNAMEPHRTVILLEMYTGMRMGEICALKGDDVDLNRGTITVRRTITRDINDKYVLGKTTKTQNGIRKVYLSDSAKNVLMDYYYLFGIPKKTELLFKGKNGLLTTGTINSYFQRLLKRNGLYKDGYSQHMNRHTYATRRIESGAELLVLKNELGHANINITADTYCDVFEEYARKKISTGEEYLQTNAINYKRKA